MKKKKAFNEKLRESVLSKGEFYVKIFITFLFVILYLLIFFFNNGLIAFERYDYAYGFKGDSFQVHFIDVENGDAILLRLPNKKTILIDTGSQKHYERVASYIKQYRFYEKLNNIDYLVLTHTDNDHIGNATKIIKDFGVKTLFRPKIYSTFEFENDMSVNDYKISDDIIYDQVIASAYKHNCEILFKEKGLRFVEGDVGIEFLSPKKDVYSENNNYSAVIMISYKNKKFLFTGDAETSIEKTLIEDYGNFLKADVLKVGHHGSKTSTSQEFLNMVKPQYAIISSSGNSTLHPNSEVVERLKQNDIEILATANIDSFALSLQNDEIKIKRAEKQKSYLEIILVIFLLIIFFIWKIHFEDLKNSNFKFKNR